jgi:hypothetical protein
MLLRLLADPARVVTVSKLIAGALSGIIPDSNGFLKMLNTFFGSQYVWITNVSMVFASFYYHDHSECSASVAVLLYPGCI